MQATAIFLARRDFGVRAGSRIAAYPVDAFVEPNDDLRVTFCEALPGFAATDLSGTVY
jgi:hypothetical protein